MRTSLPLPIGRRSAACAALFLAAGQMAFAADGYTWQWVDSTTTGNFTSISTVGDYAVASTAANRIFEFREGLWSELESWSSFSNNSNPFGSGGTSTEISDRNNIRVAALSDSEFWIVSYVSQGNYVRHRDGEFSTFGSGTGLRSGAITSFGNSLLIGRGNGGFSRITVNPSTGATDHRRETKPPTAAGLLNRISASSLQNLWLASSSRLFHSTNGNASNLTWTEVTRPEALAGTIGAIGAWQQTAESITTYYNFLAIAQDGETSLYRWDQAGGFDETPLFSLSGEDAFTVNSIYVRDSENIWLAGSSGNLWYYDGDTASKIDLGISSTLTALSGNEDGLWVVGNGGVVFTTFEVIPEPTTTALLAVAGALWLRRGCRKR